MMPPLLIKCSMNLLNQIHYFTSADNDTNLASIVDRGMEDCFLLFQEMAPLFSKNANPEVDFLSSKSPP